MIENQTQQDFLRGAMDTLGLTRDGFSVRFTVPRRTLDKWLLPDDSNDHRPLPDMARAYISEVLALHQKQGLHIPAGDI